MERVKLHGASLSRFSKRVEIALKIKGVEYEFVPEDLQNKSSELLKYNPIHKKIPVLVHDGKPIVESLIILEYIDETWKNNPLLPIDPYERAQARFWVKFIDDKLLPRLGDAARAQGEEAQKAVKEAHELLTILEKEISGKTFFGGNQVGYVDIAALAVAFWIPIVLEASGKDVFLTKDKYPAFFNWAHHISAHNVVKENLPDKEILLGSYRARFKANPSS